MKTSKFTLWDPYAFIERVKILFTSRDIYGAFSLIFFGCVLRHINRRSLLNTIYLKYVWFVNEQFSGNNFKTSQSSFIFTRLKDFKYFYLKLAEL